MNKIHVLILTAPGINCDEETLFAFSTFRHVSVDKLNLNQLKKRKSTLKITNLIIIPGGFSYGDYIYAGKIFATHLKKDFKKEIIDFLNHGRIIGICNGFQILVSSGLLPALNGYFSEQEVSLEQNNSKRFEDRWVKLKTNIPLSWGKHDKEYYLPVAHAEGKFYTNQKTITEILKRRLNVLSYFNPEGPVSYPFNPNGSLENIAGIIDKNHRIFGLMPHPERAFRKELSIDRNSFDGYKFIKNILESFNKEDM